jgi:hypothetical protein
MNKFDIQKNETSGISDIYHYLVNTPKLNYTVTDE